MVPKIAPETYKLNNNYEKSFPNAPYLYRAQREFLVFARPRGKIDRDKLGKWILPSWVGVVATPQIVYTSYSDWHSLMG